MTHVRRQRGRGRGPTHTHTHTRARTRTRAPRHQHVWSPELGVPWPHGELDRRVVEQVEEAPTSRISDLAHDAVDRAACSDRLLDVYFLACSCTNCRSFEQRVVFYMRARPAPHVQLRVPPAQYSLMTRYGGSTVQSKHLTMFAWSSGRTGSMP